MEDLLSYTKLNRKRINRICREVNDLENKYSSFSDKELSSMTDEFRLSLRNGKTIEDILPDALAVCREAIKRRLGIRPFDTQIIAAAAMSDNIIAEMKTGEGKTLVQILSSYLYALEATKDIDKSKWGSVHILTANEYLAQRDKEQNEKVFSLLKLSCDYVEDKVNSNRKDYRSKKVKAYNSDIVYGTAKTVAFDYLDDNQVKDASSRFINRKMYHAIIDEADDILLDQANRPLVLSGPMPGLDITINDKEIKWACNFVHGIKGYRSKKANVAVIDRYSQFRLDLLYGGELLYDALIFKDNGRVILSNEFQDEIYKGQKSNSLESQEEYFAKDIAVSNALLAEYYYKRDKDYVLVEVGTAKDKDGTIKKVYEVALISQATGRILHKTKYRNGIQQAIETKEELLSGGKYLIKKSTDYIIRSTITYPSFVGLYETGISGMTGTSDVEEFNEIYGLQTYVVPTRKPSIRKDEETEIYATKRYKYRAIVKDIKKHHRRQQPILVGTTCVKESNELCKYLDVNGIKYQRLDAVNDKDEAYKIAQAGRKGMITIATNMAGRGTDIKLEEGVASLGGLYVIGTSKNSSSRIDRQLMGRCARQGLPGKTKYYQSLEDDLVILRYGKYKLSAMKKYYSTDDGLVTSSKVKKIVDKCQKIEEGISKQNRKTSKEVELKIFDLQRNKLFEQRNKLLNASQKEVLNIIIKMIGDYTNTMFENNELFKVKHLIDLDKCYDEDESKYKDNVYKSLLMSFKKSRGNYNVSEYIEYLRGRTLDIVDSYWISHLMNLEEMRKSILGIANFGLSDIDTFERMASRLFQNMNESIQNEVITYSIMPNLKFGSYVISNSDDEEEVKKHESNH